MLNPHALPRGRMARAQLEIEADDLLEAANDNGPKKKRLRFRGTRPAWNWLRKKDARAAAALWIVARQSMPEAANDNHDTDADGYGIDRRKDGKARGRRRAPQSPANYLALPPIHPRLGDAEPERPTLRGWQAWFDLKPQRDRTLPLYPYGRFTKCVPAVAPGASFLGATSGLGAPKVGKQRGDVRRPAEVDVPEMPERIAKTIEAMLARHDLAGVGRALGYRGGYSDRAGGKAMREAGTWALHACAKSRPLRA